MTSGLMGDDEDLLTEDEVATLLQLSVLLVRRLHREGTGPPCVKIGRQTRYRQAAVQRWLSGDGQGSSPVENR